MPTFRGTQRHSDSSEQAFEERAAIMEYDAGLPRIIAEERAWIITYGESGRRRLIVDFIQERAAILEHEAGLSRWQAENEAQRLAKEKYGVVSSQKSFFSPQ